MKVGKIKHIHRVHNGWEFRAVSTRVVDEGKEKEVVFGISTENGVTRVGLEIYQGENYIVKSKDRSMSWRHEEGAIPKKWQNLYSILEELHRDIDWKNDGSLIN